MVSTTKRVADYAKSIGTHFANSLYIGHVDRSAVQCRGKCRNGRCSRYIGLWRAFEISSPYGPI